MPRRRWRHGISHNFLHRCSPAPCKSLDYNPISSVPGKLPEYQHVIQIVYTPLLGLAFLISVTWVGQKTAGDISKCRHSSERGKDDQYTGEYYLVEPSIPSCVDLVRYSPGLCMDRLPCRRIGKAGAFLKVTSFGEGDRQPYPIRGVVFTGVHTEGDQRSGQRTNRLVATTKRKTLSDGLSADCADG